MLALEKYEKPGVIVRYIERVLSSLAYNVAFKTEVLSRLSKLFAEVSSEVVTLCITYYENELSSIASNMEEAKLAEFYRECFIPSRELPRNSPFFLQYIKVKLSQTVIDSVNDHYLSFFLSKYLIHFVKYLIDSDASELIDILTESGIALIFHFKIKPLTKKKLTSL